METIGELLYRMSWCAERLATPNCDNLLLGVSADTVAEIVVAVGMYSRQAKAATILLHKQRAFFRRRAPDGEGDRAAGRRHRRGPAE